MAYRTWALENPGPYQVMFTQAVPGFTPSEDAATVAMGSFQVLLDAIEAQQAAGRFRPTDAIEIAWAHWGMSHGLVMLELGGMRPTPGPVVAEAIYRNAVHATIRGFAPDTR